MVSSYLKYSTTAKKPCTHVHCLPVYGALAVWLHGISLHICDNSTRCCNHMVTSNPERDVFTTTVCVPNAFLQIGMADIMSDNLSGWEIPHPVV